MKYKVITHWGGFRKHPPREGNLTEPMDFKAETLSGRKLHGVLEMIFMREQNEITQRCIPSASVGDIIELEDGRRFLIENGGFSEVNTEDNSKTFLIDQGRGARTVRFSAWRNLRPNIRGYGMTAEEAIFDLTQNVQPL